eukprot:1728321-Lingulodinium_polyedra.AAC.1
MGAVCGHNAARKRRAAPGQCASHGQDFARTTRACSRTRALGANWPETGPRHIRGCSETGPKPVQNWPGVKWTATV